MATSPGEPTFAIGGLKLRLVKTSCDVDSRYRRQGLLGTHVIQALANLDDVHGTDLDEMDITDPGSVMTTLALRPPDVIVHTAALKGNQPSRDRPLDFFRVNTAGTVNLLEACRQLGIKRFVFVSSLTVHGPSEDPVDEASPWAPAHPYAGTKGRQKR